MSNKNIFVTLVILLIGYLSYSLFFKNNDEKLILNTISSIQEQAEFDAPLKKVEVYSRIQNIKGYLSKPIALKAIDGSRVLADINSFDDIQAGIFLGSKYLAMHKTSTEDASVSINKDKTEAEVSLIITSNGTEQGQVNSFEEIFSVNLTFIKVEEKWLIKSIEASRQTL